MSLLSRPVLAGMPLVLVAGALSGISVASSGPAGSGNVSITTVSDRADLISAGDALVQLAAPGGNVGALRVQLNGTDITNTWRKQSNADGLGLITGLRLGQNVLTATLPGGLGARLTLTNHPQGGPDFTGPQIQPWACQAGATDKQCDAKPTYSYSYIGQDGQAHSYDPSSPPSDSEISSTTTTDGVTVPFIYRVETGYIDRDQYSITALWQPGKPWTAWAPQKQFNHRMVITHGASCDTTYGAGSAPSTTDSKLVGGGFIVMSNALDNAGHNCNLITQAESLVMTKEYAIDHYGTVKWTIGSGCSGGSLVQQQVANAFPGLYQGITPQCSFTDAWSSAMEYVDYVMLLKYFEDPSRWAPGTVWTPTAIQQVLDHPNVGNPITFTTAIPNSGDPSRSCPDVPAAQVYDPQTNPKGVKCTLQDYMVNVFGKRPDGFANRPFGNDGIQYGLQGLLNGELTPEQFVDLNTKVGGLNYQGDKQAARSKPDLIGLERAYRSGSVDSATHLNDVAIIDLRGPDEGSFHDVYRTYAMRQRLLRNFGTAANQVLWRGQVPLLGDTTFADDAVFAMDGWLAQVNADHRSVPLAQKIIQDKPGTLTDRCTNGNGVDIPSWECDALVASYGTPRMAAGGPLADDTLECQKKPLRKSDYPMTFTDDEWAALQKTFPDGVCDYSKPGVDQHGATAWLTYQKPDGQVIYGGTPMGPPPRSVPFESETH